MRFSAWAVLTAFSSSTSFASIAIQEGSLSGNPAVAWNGGEFLVAWTDTRNGYDVYASIVAANGTVLDPGGVPVSELGGGIYEGGPVIATDGTDFLVVWRDFRDGPQSRIYGARVRGSDGAVLDPISIPISSGPGEEAVPTVAWGGTHYLVAWDDARNGQHTVRAARVSAGGEVLDPVPTIFFSGGSTELWSGLASNGNGFLLTVGAANETVSALGISSTGVVGSPMVVDALSMAIPRVITAAGEYAVVWGLDEPGGSLLRVGRVDSLGALLSPVHDVHVAANGYLDPAIGFDGEAYSLAWTEGTDVLAVFLDGCHDDATFLVGTNVARPAIAGPNSPFVVSAGPAGAQGNFSARESCPCDGDDDNDDSDDGGHDDDDGDSLDVPLASAASETASPAGCATASSGDAVPWPLLLGFALMIKLGRRQRRG